MIIGHYSECFSWHRMTVICACWLISSMQLRLICGVLWPVDKTSRQKRKRWQWHSQLWTLFQFCRTQQLEASYVIVLLTVSLILQLLSVCVSVRH